MGDAVHTRVLLVDDEPNLLITLAAILRKQGYDVTTAPDGEQAVALCRHQGFDVVLMDIRMPGLNGIEAFRHIRRHRAGDRVILMSAYGEEPLKQTALEEGAIAFIDKPLDVEKVLTVIEQSAESTILIVAKDDTTVQSLRRSLADRYHVTVTDSPHNALELAEQIRFDIIFIDVALPVMNGLELYLAIKNITPSSVFIMVAEQREEFLRIAEQAVQQTAYTVIPKPIDLDHLVALLNRIERQSVSNALKKPEA